MHSTQAIWYEVSYNSSRQSKKESQSRASISCTYVTYAQVQQPEKQRIWSKSGYVSIYSSSTPEGMKT